tara:strand:+ start:22 stop:396 length:375 start_codon:yes stop_codon:yes gene_type:complete
MHTINNMITSDQEKYGNELYKSNNFFSDLCRLMKNNEFKIFYNQYFKNWSDIQCMIFYMKLYSTIQYEYKIRFNMEITDNVMCFAMHNVMKNTKTRKIAMKLFKDFETNNTQNVYNFGKLLTFD